MKSTRSAYMFKLREQTEFPGQFMQTSIEIHPTALNGRPVKIAIADILKIHRVNDLHWAPPKLKYFVFELRDNITITGNPIEKTCLVNSSILKQCKVEFDNMVEVEKIA